MKNLSKKKALAAKALKVGKGRIIFLEARLEEIKEAITKQDIKDLAKEGAIIIKDIKGRRKINKKNKRSTGNIRKKPNRRKKDYMSLTRKLRNNASELRKEGKITKEEYEDIRKKIKDKHFKSKAYLKEYIKEKK